MMPTDSVPTEFLEVLGSLAREADEVTVWPAESWATLRKLGACRWSIPQTYGGDGKAGAELLHRYEALASSCLTSCFILSQRDAACRRLVGSGQESLCRELLPALATGDRFATVGLAQLTTSRQHGPPPVTALFDDESVTVNGVIPWVTGAGRANHVVIGAATEDRRQILAVLPTDLPGVSVGPPLELAALQGSVTAELRCDKVRLPRRWLLAGPIESVLRGERGGTGGLETSCLALGLAGAAVDFLEKEANSRPELRRDLGVVKAAHQELRTELYRLAEGTVVMDAAQSLRARANALVLRATQAALAASKGTGFLRQHPAQRWARQALFFLVWSCPWPVTAATMSYLIGSEEGICS
jgi:alkylation response protein AidB-like acyl-CoA dehydrogenase